MTTESTIQQQGDAMPSATPTASKNLTGKALQRALRNLELDIITERLNACRIDLNTPPPEIEPLISINGQCICSRGNISAIVGEAKSKKTFLCTALVASAMAYPHPSSHPFDNVSNNTMLNVAWMDTEQSIHHVYKVAKRINDITAVSAIGVSKDPRIRCASTRPRSAWSVSTTSCGAHHCRWILSLLTASRTLCPTPTTWRRASVWWAS